MMRIVLPGYYSNKPSREQLYGMSTNTNANDSPIMNCELGGLWAEEQCR